MGGVQAQEEEEEEKKDNKGDKVFYWDAQKETGVMMVADGCFVKAHHAEVDDSSFLPCHFGVALRHTGHHL